MTENCIKSAFATDQMAYRKQQYFNYIRSQRLNWFAADGAYLPEIENDRRITFWCFPALVSSPDPEERAWAQSWYAAEPAWNEYNIFTSSSIALNLVRERQYLTSELILKSEEHLAKFGYVEGGRKPGACINDYTFHGYNDNMPALATRQLILSGDVLNNSELTDAGLFRLEGLCVHFQRRGMLSEHTSGTYLPATITALMDIAECSLNADAREMALACVQRVLLDLLCHFHQTTGAIGGVQSRAYTIDLTGGLSGANTLLWYITGHPLLINPIEVFSSGKFEGPIHHGGCKAFTAAGHTEVFSPSYRQPGQDFLEFARTPHAEEHEVKATMDCGPFGTSVQSQAMSGVTTAFHRRLWSLASNTTGIPWSTQNTCLQGTVSAALQPVSWRDRINFWEYLVADEDYGRLVPNHRNELAEVDHVNNIGQFRTLQKKGSAMSMGLISASQEGKHVTQLRSGIVFGTFLRMPDEFFQDDERLIAWDGVTAAGSWQFLRFGQVYVGLRAVGAAPSASTGKAEPVLPRRVIRHRYLRLEIPLIEEQKIEITPNARMAIHFGSVVEVSDEAECGSFEEFRRQCLQGSWEYFTGWSRNSRYCGRNGEFYISDSPADGSVRVSTINGVLPEQPKLFEATGLDPKLVNLFPDDRQIRVRRLLFNPSFAGTPFYSVDGLVLSEK